MKVIKMMAFFWVNVLLLLVFARILRAFGLTGDQIFLLTLLIGGSVGGGLAYLSFIGEID